MQRRLMLMRHAKSSWKSQVPTDHERPLNERGRRDAARVGKRLAKLGWVPDFVVSSDSRRTEETWERIQKSFPDARFRFTRVLYAGGPSELRSEVARLSGDVRTVLALGHNPGWEEAVDGAQRPRDADHDGERRAAGRRRSDVARGAARPVERRRRRPPEAALTAGRGGG